jgi:hypothetical protein
MKIAVARSNRNVTDKFGGRNSKWLVSNEEVNVELTEVVEETDLKGIRI